MTAVVEHDEERELDQVRDDLHALEGRLRTVELQVAENRTAVRSLSVQALAAAFIALLALVGGVGLYQLIHAVTR